MNRRSFMQSILALGAAPAIVRYDALMRPVARDVLVGVWPAALAPGTERIVGLVGGYRFIATLDDPLAQRGQPCMGRVGDPGFVPADTYTEYVNVEVARWARIAIVDDGVER